jgi:succinate dehydrogenase flavin-adding protein (antitoxin of CptAB toxin-antitoxin module)
METLRKRLRYLLSRNGSLEIDAILSPLIGMVDDIPECILDQVIMFLEQQQPDLYDQLRGILVSPKKLRKGAQWVLKNCSHNMMGMNQ